MVAEPQQHRQQPLSQGVGDLGAEIDEGAHWLSGTPDDDKVAPAKGSPKRGVTPSRTPSSTGVGSDSVAGGNANVKQLASYIYNRAPNYGADPNLALGIALREGLNPNTVGKGGNPDSGGYSYGPFQLFSGGLAPQFHKDTGLDQSDPSTQQAQVDWTLKWMADHPKEISNQGSTWMSIKDNHGVDNLSSIGQNYANQNGGFAQPAPTANSAPPPPQAQSAPPPVQSQVPTNGPQAQADPMSNLYNKVALGPEVAAGYDNPQALFAPDATAKRGGRMRKRLDDGGDAGGDGGDGGDGGAAANAAAANAAAGYGSGVTGQAAAAGYGGVGMGSPAGAPAGTSTTGTGGFGGFGGGDNGFGAANGMGSSVGFGSPGVSTAGVGGVGSTGVGGVGAPSGGVAGPCGGGGGARGAGRGVSGGGGGTASGGSGTTLAQQYAALVGGTPAFYDAGFGLGKGGFGNVGAAQSNTATLAALQNSPMRYGFVQGNDPGLANSNTGKAALGTAPAPNLMAQQFAAATGQGANNGPQGVGFGGGSGVGPSGATGFNNSPTGAEGVSTSQLGPAPQPNGATVCGRNRPREW